MTTPNYFDLSGDSIRIGWYPDGSGGPVKEGQPLGPVLQYTDVSGSQTITGKKLTVSSTAVGTFVTAIVKDTGVVPGAVTAFAALIPDVAVDGRQSVAISTLGALSTHRGVAQLGPGQLERYTLIPLTGTAASLTLPA
jgi:hypothetical protein